MVKTEIKVNKMTKIKLFANFREIAGVNEIEIEAETLSEVFERLVEKFPKLETVFFEIDEQSGKRKLKEYVQVMISGRHVRGDDRLKERVSRDDTVAIFPPVSGG